MLKDGYKFAAPPLVLGAVAAALGWRKAATALLLAGSFVVYFFRDPDRVVPGDPGVVVSPADGRSRRGGYRGGQSAAEYARAIV